MADLTCPCCGGPMASPTELEPLRHVKLTMREREVLDEYLATFPRALKTPSLIDRLYQLDPNGGPTTPRNVVSVHVHRINRVIGALGWRLSPAGGDARGLFKVQ